MKYRTVRLEKTSGGIPYYTSDIVDDVLPLAVKFDGRTYGYVGREGGLFGLFGGVHVYRENYRVRYHRSWSD